MFKLFPHIVKTKIDYKFCGAFGTTNNNMGLIGKSPTDPNLLYFISCGANGIINAMNGINLIIDIIENKPNKLQNIFNPCNTVKK